VVASAFFGGVNIVQAPPLISTVILQTASTLHKAS
jgi:hypothetical protein